MEHHILFSIARTQALCFSSRFSAIDIIPTCLWLLDGTFRIPIREVRSDSAVVIHHLELLLKKKTCLKKIQPEEERRHTNYLLLHNASFGSVSSDTFHIPVSGPDRVTGAILAAWYMAGFHRTRSEKINVFAEKYWSGPYFEDSLQLSIVYIPFRNPRLRSVRFLPWFAPSRSTARPPPSGSCRSPPSSRPKSSLFRRPRSGASSSSSARGWRLGWRVRD